MEDSVFPRSRLVRFGVFELDVRSGELWKSGVRVTLQEQPLKLLECLLEHPGEIVTREELRGRLWPGDTFVDFEQGVNAAVKRLREALADSADAPRFVQTLPRRGYRFIAPVERGDGHDDRHRITPSDRAPSDRAPSVSTPRVSGISRLPRAAVGVAVGVAIAVLLIVAARSSVLIRPTRLDNAGAAPAPRLLPLTTFNGPERQPTFSPDGRQVAFAWDGTASDNSDIYITLVGSAEARRLTTDAGRDFAPQWSPDGRQIAYVRAVDHASQRIRVMSSLGGSDRELSDFPVWSPIAWSPDGRFIAAGRAGDMSKVGRSHAIYLIPVASSDAPRALTRPDGDMNDWSPAFSPDGRRLAYASCQELVYRSLCHVKVVDVDASFAPTGPPRQLTPASVWSLYGITWTHDGTGVLYSARQGSLVHLWRVDAAGVRAPERIELAGRGVQFPAIAPAGARLAYTLAIEDADIYRVDVPGGVAQPLARSSVLDSLPNISPDGRRIAYCSARSHDALEVWVAGLDGSAPERLTHGPGDWQCSPSWSPDGTRIAFDSRAPDGSWHVWTIGVEGGPPRQVTTDAGSQVRPTWSRDGRWIYFVWKRDHDRDVWRTRGPGGPTERVTHAGATMSAARESIDGTGLWYKHVADDGPLLFQPLTGGAPREVIPCVRAESYSIGAAGVYYVPCETAGEKPRDVPVRLFNPATAVDRPFTRLDIDTSPRTGRINVCIIMSPNNRTLIYSRLNNNEADLMLIEHFR